MVKTRKLLSVLFAVAMLLTVFPTNVYAQESAGEPVYAEVPYYGREALSACYSGDTQSKVLAAYDAIVAGVEASQKQISVEGITAEQLQVIMDAYRKDHAEHFWVGNGYRYSVSGGFVCQVEPVYLMSGDDLTTAKAAFTQGANELLSSVKSDMNEYEREKILHDLLAAKVTYDTAAVTDDTRVKAHTAYGALAENLAVCDGYAKAFQYLLRQVGIQSFIVTGNSVSPGSETPVGHAWNLVRIDGKWHHVDLTWDDQENSIYYAYFNKTDVVIQEDHTIEAVEYDLPKADSEDADYFTLNGGKMESFNAETIANLLKTNGMMARMYVTGNVTEFWNALNTEENLREIVGQLEVAGSISFGMSGIGREITLTIETGETPGTFYRIAGSVGSYGSGSEEITLTLTKSGATTPSHRITLQGGRTYFTMEHVEAGTYTLKATKQGHVATECTILVSAQNVNTTITLYLTGDLDQNGSADIRDLIRLKKVLEGQATSKASADLNGDNLVNVDDFIVMRKIILGIG